VAVIKKPRNISSALKIATCTLLSSTSINTHASEEDRNKFLDSAFLYYSEKDRVTVYEPVVSYRKYAQFDEFIDYKLTLDAMTGASPNGASPTDTVQTFTGSSGSAGYTVPANETPTRNFQDTRVALNVTTQTPLTNITSRSTGYALSAEQDYASAGYNSTFSKEYNNKLTTLTAGGGLSLDLVFPTGGTPKALTNVNAPAPAGGGEGEDGEGGEGGEFNPDFKGTFDVLFGITQVLNRYTLMQLNYSHEFIRGYLTDPYKIVSVIDSNTGYPYAPADSPDGVYLTEKRPDSRDTNSIYWKTVLYVFGDVLRVSYRHYWDDWGIKSNTVDVKYRFEFAGKYFIQPHYRHYDQTAADFYRHSLLNTEAVPSHVSADFRLAKFTGHTVGLKIGAKLSDSSTFDFRVEKYTQEGDARPSDAVGIQKKFDLFPKLETSIFQISYSKYF